MRRRIAIVVVALSVAAVDVPLLAQGVRADEQETQPPIAPPEPSCQTCAAAKATRDAEASAQGLAALMKQADAVLLVEIAATDTSAMPADGPMQVDATVIRTVSGTPAAGSTIHFSANAWAGPTYEPGEQRIVLLARLTNPALGQWTSLETGWMDLFFTNETADVCSAQALQTFLERLGPQPLRPRLQFQAIPVEG